ncbi:putative 5'-methylthioadenosine phosphorylase [Lineolata rhizophorae]|uniref:S-methyl-5'-thioadenosine phosphorylase n=1 Tax=Lineolata rhizophorae TaxID=578093 RepID=A0A6A6NYL2_9PEZI|nr:putative 5'-methylthioadenosine phosphorylase [Lineolata rhizophorae]
MNLSFLPTLVRCQRQSLRETVVRCKLTSAKFAANMADISSTYSDPIHIAVIGGTGLQHLPGFTHVANLNVTTPWGMPSSPISVLHHPSPTSGKPIPIAFISRHGVHHELAPHEVPSRANIAALRSIGVRTIIAFSAVGSLKEEIKPRDFVVPDQVIDRTKGIRPFTFFEGGMVGHVGFADPFDEGLAKVIRTCGHSLEGDGVVLHDKGILVCMEGPQFSTRAESNLYRSWGGSVINMSCLPESKLAREAEISYQMICMATDYDCWHNSGDVSVEMVMGHMKANSQNALRFVGAVLNELSKEEHGEQVLAKHLDGQTKFAGAITAKPGRSEEASKKLGWLFPGYFD